MGFAVRLENQLQRFHVFKAMQDSIKLINQPRNELDCLGTNKKYQNQLRFNEFLLRSQALMGPQHPKTTSTERARMAMEHSSSSPNPVMQQEHWMPHRRLYRPD